MPKLNTNMLWSKTLFSGIMLFTNKKKCCTNGQLLLHATNRCIYIYIFTCVKIEYDSMKQLLITKKIIV